MKGKTCCVTGHRDLPQNEINKIKAALEHEIDAAVTDGFTCFMSGFADGVDQYFAELVLERKQTNPALELIAVIPYRKRLDSLNKKTRTRELLEACADVVVIQEKYLPSVYSHRNRYMVEHSDRVIAVYDGRAYVEPDFIFPYLCRRNGFRRYADVSYANRKTCG